MLAAYSGSVAAFQNQQLSTLRRFGRRLVPRHPAQLIVLGFALAIAAGTGLLMLPVARSGDGGAPLLDALFTATSAVCVTG